MPAEKRPSDTKPSRHSTDWNALRKRSLEPGGFGEDRVDLWPKLLNVSPEKAHKVYQDAKLEDPQPETSPHQDERQIGLDTDRSFVLYPVDPKQDREALQSNLNALLVSLFRKRPRLSYFQGYHDIVTVLFLTLPAEMHLACVEKLSLHRLRDSMGTGLEPVLGLLRVTKHLLKLADYDYEKTLEQSSPLPFYALSNLLTLFSHDMPTLPLIQHVFDYLLCRPPIAVVYLATAIILSRKEEVIRLEEEGEDGMIHSLLSSLPNLADGAPEMQKSDVEEKYSPWNKRETESDGDCDNTFFKEEDNVGEWPQPRTLETSAHPASSTPYVKIEGDEQSLEHLSLNANNVNLEPSDIRRDAAAADDNDDREISSESRAPGPNSPQEGNTAVNGLTSLAIDSKRKHIPSEHEGEDEGEDGDGKLDCRLDTRLRRENPEIPANAEAAALQPVKLEHDADGARVAENSDKGTHLPLSEANAETGASDRHSSLRRPQLDLTDLLKRADELYELYPPSHSGLALSSIMGPQSVVYTWSESPSALPSDNTAEAMVQHPELVVYPHVEPSDTDKESDSFAYEKGGRRGKGKGKETGGPNKLRGKRRHRLGKSPFRYMEKRTTVVAGTVLVVGVAMAVYGIRARNAGAGTGAGAGGPLGGVLGGNDGHGSGFSWGFGLFHGLADGGDIHVVPLSAKDWRRLGGRVGGALVGMSEKIMNGLSSGS
ncbi:unnamed protein product [Cyclocybe aegerita]|uniref:Rab-GAP TBC domain-containing protein n=1 Tax=Cyclocybe aegerita TaxID=1973307 RepID=A0A8S0XFQ7_CYCAE|nr:unnamed protein product [Cyclocybe aegerita]